MAEALTEVDEYTATVTVPQAGDDRTATSVRGALQSLANRAKWLKTRFGDAVRLLPGSELLYTDAARVPERRARHDYLPLTDFQYSGSSYKSFYELGKIYMVEATDQLNGTLHAYCQLRIPPGSRLNSVHCGIFGAVDTVWDFKVRTVTFNPLGESTLGTEAEDPGITMGVSGNWAMATTGLNWEIGRGMRVEVHVQAHKPDAAPLYGVLGYIHNLHIDWLDAGPISGN